MEACRLSCQSGLLNFRPCFFLSNSFLALRASPSLLPPKKVNSQLSLRVETLRHMFSTKVGNTHVKRNLKFVKLEGQIQRISTIGLRPDMTNVSPSPRVESTPRFCTFVAGEALHEWGCCVRRCSPGGAFHNVIPNDVESGIVVDLCRVWPLKWGAMAVLAAVYLLSCLS